LLTSGCSFFYADQPSYLHTPQSTYFQKSEKNYLINGRIMFKNTEGSHSGEMTIQMFTNSDFKLSVFAPLVGTLLYSISANAEKLLILNFQEKYYILENNNNKMRKTWLGMDLSLIELKWLILGKISLENNNWEMQKISKTEYRILKGSTEIIFHFNSQGHIEYMEKFVDGFLEYRAEIPIYKKYFKKKFPRKIDIKDFSKKNHWKIIISEIKTQTKKIKELDFNPPKYFRQFK